MVRVMSVGLVDYLPQTETAPRLRVSVDKPSATTPTSAVVNDPWDRWSLRANVNGNASGEASSNNIFLSTNFNAIRTIDDTSLDGYWSAGVRAFWNASTFSNIIRSVRSSARSSTHVSAVRSAGSSQTLRRGRQPRRSI